MLKKIKHRKNPHLGLSNEGYLINAQFSNWAKDNFPGYSYNPNCTLWVHATVENDYEKWLNDRFKAVYLRHKSFYIGSGDKLFGNNLYFFRYKPTKIFDPLNDQDLAAVVNRAEDYFDNNREVFHDFCKKARHVIEKINLDVKYTNLTDIFSRPSIVEAFKRDLSKVLRQGSYGPIGAISDLLRELGFTANYEVEQIGFNDPSKVNVEVFSEDMPNLELAGYFKVKEFGSFSNKYQALEKIGYTDIIKQRGGHYRLDAYKAEWYYCPVCEREFFVEDKAKFVQSILEKGEVCCPDCRGSLSYNPPTPQDELDPHTPNSVLYPSLDIGYAPGVYLAPSTETYMIFHSSELKNKGAFSKRYGVNVSHVKPREFAAKLGIIIPSELEFSTGHLHNGQLVSALFVSPSTMSSNNFGYALVVEPKHQSQGLVEELVKVKDAEHKTRK